MEHRYSQRTRASAKLLIYKRGVPVAMGRAQNISRHGIFVETDYSDISVHQPLEVEFLTPEAKTVGSRRLKTIVVHKAQTGFGVEIEDDSSYGVQDRPMIMPAQMPTTQVALEDGAPQRMAVGAR